jgi:hypothetical protein
MRREHWTGTVDYPIDSTQYLADLCSFDSESDFKDEVGSYSRYRDESDVHPCDHKKTHISTPENVVVRASGASGSYTYELTFTGNLPGYATVLLGLPTASVQDLNSFVGDLQVQGSATKKPRIDWEALENQFLDISQNIIQKEVLIGETLAQPQLVIDAIRFLISPARGMQRLVKYAVKRYGRQALRSTTGDLTRRILKDAANSTLMLNFGIKPLISDIRGIEKSVRVINNQLDYLKRHRGQFVPVRVRESSFSTEKDEEYTSDYHPTYATLYKSPVDHRIHAAIGAYFRVRQDLTLEANLNAFAQYFGIGQVVGLLWELVPFSFVVDWVSNVQERIQKLSQVHTFNPYGESRGFVASLKDTQIQSVRLSSGVLPVYGASIHEDSSGTELASVRTTRYTRFLDLPETRSLFDLSNLGTSQYINGGSLLIQHLLKNR